jgi:NAD(P)-dependent dehydrogenase (short-subunit alcohol dehydrogenase family)
MAVDLQGRRAIVTGAGSGMGAAMSAALVNAGATVLAVDRDGPALEKLKNGMQRDNAGPRLQTLVADLSSREECEAIVPRAMAAMGGLHILVNNAGVGMAAIDPDYSVSPVMFWRADISRWQRLMDINLRAPLILASHATPIFLEQGWGRIINVTTSLDTMLRPTLSAYGQSKAALEAGSASWARELEGSGVTVNVLVPGGPVDTAFLPQNTQFPREQLIKPDIMGPPVVWLASKAADGFTNRRVVARDWDGVPASREAAETASSPAAWTEAGSRARVPGEN